MSDSPSPIRTVLFALLGLGRAEKIHYGTLAALAIPALAVWFVFLPRWKFSDQDEQLFRAARHGNVAGVESSLAAGACLTPERRRVLVTLEGAQLSSRPGCALVQRPGGEILQRSEPLEVRLRTDLDAARKVLAALSS